ncbi:MAG: NADH-quinone oxidoreductase subunit I [Candidatus Omnitrophota bacterium]|nr:NADH-quinone oxidoreductase subunit I [Candidatus Omnitrophota bacterium]
MKKYFQNIAIGALSLIKGLVVTFKNIFCPKITLQYPSERQSMAERFRGLVDLRVNKCIVCSQCVRICPTACLSLSAKLTEEKKKALESFKYNMELCCFCGLCEQVCPVSAVYLNKIYEVASFNRQDLYIDLLNPEKYVKFVNPAVK